MNNGWSISCEMALIWMSLGFTDDQSTVVQVMAWCRQAKAITWANVDPDLCRDMASVSLKSQQITPALWSRSGLIYIPVRYHILSKRSDLFRQFPLYSLVTPNFIELHYPESQLWPSHRWLFQQSLHKLKSFYMKGLHWICFYRALLMISQHWFRWWLGAAWMATII